MNEQENEDFRLNANEQLNGFIDRIEEKESKDVGCYSLGLFDSLYRNSSQLFC